MSFMSDGDGVEEKDWTPLTIGALDLMIEGRAQNQSADLRDVYVDQLTSADGDNGKIDTSATDVYYNNSGRLDAYQEGVYMAKRGNLTNDEFNDGSVNTSIWNVYEEAADDFGSSSVTESGGEVTIYATAQVTGGDTDENEAYIRTQSPIRDITVFEVSYVRPDLSNPYPTEGMKAQVFINGQKVAEEQELLNNNEDYETHYNPRPPHGRWMVIQGGENSGLYRNGNRVADTPGKGDVEFRVITVDSEGEDVEMRVNYFETWDFQDGKIVCKDIESMSEVTSALAHIKATLPQGADISVDFSLDGGVTWPEPFRDKQPDEIYYLGIAGADQVGGPDLAARFNITTASTTEPPEIEALSSMAWDT